MPFVSRPPAVSAGSVSPPPRTRIIPPPDVEIGRSSLSDAVKPPSAPTAATAKREKRQPTGDYLEGYCRTSDKNRFKPGNLGGPGRPRKDSKSQDDLMRAELLKSQQVTEGGKRRRKTMRELVPGLLVKATLQKLNPKELRALQEEARRLFPDRAPDANSMPAFDRQTDLEYVRDMISAMRIGEPASEGADPMADFMSTVLGGDDLENDDGAWGEGDWDAAHEEQTDEAA